MSKLHEVGFQHPASGAPARTLRPVAVAQLIATVSLALCTLIAATVVSIDFARADIGCVVAAAGTAAQLK
jgi:F0F1-type ATP synthase membrane subunit a